MSKNKKIALNFFSTLGKHGILLENSKERSADGKRNGLKFLPKEFSIW